MSSSSTSPQWKPDVFVSFGEDDVIKTFIANLFKRLNQVGINYFEDDNREGARQTMAKCPKAIHEVRFAIIVFSTNYVNSSPCLDELVEILNCERDPELVVIPIFYIDRAKVLEAASKGRFKEALGKVIKEEKWRSTLANGLANGNDSKLIDIIVERLVKGINSLYPTKDFGPFGGKGETTWKSRRINGIEICYAVFIKSIAFEVDEDTSSKPQNDGKSHFKVKLENGECISSFAGYCDHARNIINSLTFRTNQRTWGPFGREEGDYFAVPSKAGKVIRFFGTRNEESLKSIGAHVELNSKEFYRVQSVGLIGTEGKAKWDEKRTRANVRKIVVELDSSRFIRSIKFTYEEEKGRLVESPRYGSNTGGDVNTITIDGRDEYLTSISGYYTDAGITSLTFRTNKQMNKPIGEEKGTHFSSPATAGKIVGFYGYIGEHLCGIGAYFEPISDLHQIQPLYQVNSIGPFGGGNVWDDWKFDGVREIYLYVTLDHNICSIMFVYEDGSVEGRKVMHPKGVSHNSEEKKVELVYPREYLTSISGYTREDGSISSLTFHSNRKRHGPFGKEEGEYFCYPSTGSRIIGFYGTWGKTLNSIGVYVEPIPHLYPFKIVRPTIEGSGGTPWDDGVHTNVRGFRTTVTGPRESRIIQSITFMYDDNGSLVEGSRHGGEDAGKWEMLDFPEQRLTKIEGRMLKDPRTGQTIIYDLTIYTTNKTNGYYGPYAADTAKSNRKGSTPFVIPEGDGRIVGFFGTAGTYLNSVGARLEPY